jgi:hypothetical protein
MMVEQYIAEFENQERDLNGPSGQDCVAFVDFENGWAAKVYAYAGERNSQWKRQQDAAAFDLGPEVGNKFQFVLNDHTYYAFLTEVVDVATDDIDFVDGKNDWGDPQWTEYGQEALEELRNGLAECIGFHFYDDWPPNCGVKNGRLICIDFGG